MKRGFTLIEFMVIASVLAIVATILLHLIALHRVRPTRHNLEQTRKAAEQYKSQNGSYPDSLDRLVEKQLVQPDVLKDQWGNTLVLRVSAGTLQLYSMGPDGIADNRDDIVNE